MYFQFHVTLVFKMMEKRNFLVLLFFSTLNLQLNYCSLIRGSRKSFIDISGKWYELASSGATTAGRDSSANFILNVKKSEKGQ